MERLDIDLYYNKCYNCLIKNTKLLDTQRHTGMDLLNC